MPLLSRSPFQNRKRKRRAVSAGGLLTFPLTERSVRRYKNRYLQKRSLKRSEAIEELFTKEPGVMPPDEFIKEMSAEKPRQESTAKPVHSYIKSEEPEDGSNDGEDEFTAPDTMIEDSSEYVYPPLNLLAGRLRQRPCGGRGKRGASQFRAP